jgi:predicted nucleotidyltransferase
MLAAQSEMLDKGVKIHPITQKTLDLFVERVKEHEKENLSQIILFGSVARGEANKDSDIDVLIVLKESSFEKRMKICDLSASVKWDMDFDDNAYLQTITISEEESNGLDYYELMLNTEREGVILYDAKE